MKRRAVARGSTPATAPRVAGGHGRGRPTGAVGTVVELQRQAGNRAVTELWSSQPEEHGLVLQRLPFAAPPAAAPKLAGAATDSLDDRLKAADKLVATQGWLTSAVVELYGAKPRPNADLVTAILTGHLRVVEATNPTTIADATLQKQAKTIKGRVEGGLRAGLNAAMAAITSEVGGRQGDVDAQVTNRLRSRPWTFRDLLGDLWSAWLQCTPVDELRRANVSPDAPWKALKQLAKNSVTTYATQHFTGAALGALAAARPATAKRLDALDHWVTTEAELDTLTDGVLNDAESKAVPRTEQAWKDLRARMSDVVVAAETDLIKANLPKALTQGTTEQVWSRVRGMYAGTMAKPVWRFYRDDVVGFTVLGKSFDKAGGVHRGLLSALARVEASARRLAGNAYAAPNLTHSNGFRFQPQDGDFEKPHVSFHATGQAIDFDGDFHNMITTSAAKSTVGVLGGVDFETSGNLENVPELAKLAAELDKKYAEKKVLEDQLKGTLEDEEKGKVDQRLKDLAIELAGLPDRDDVKRLRDKASRIYDDVVKAQTDFATVWKELTKGSGKAADVDLDALRGKLGAFKKKITDELAPVQKRLDELKTEIQTLQDQGAAKKEASAAQKGSLVKAQEERGRLEQLKKELDGRVSAVADIEKRFTPGKAGRTPEEGKALLTELEMKVFQAGGLTNLPKWMVLAFVENGFTWGGGWHGKSDAMHFSYMAPVEGINQSGY